MLCGRMGQTRQHAIAVQTSNPLPACVPAVLLLLQDVLRLCGITQLLDAALDGYNATILAYGQTGSGKTFTMSGEWGRGSAGPLLPHCRALVCSWVCHRTALLQHLPALPPLAPALH
jgi:hypothetical protein